MVKTMLDTPTLHVVMALSQFMMGVFLLILWRDNKTEKALLIWASTNLFCCFTTYLFVLQGQLHPFITVVVPAWGFIGFVVGYWMGLRYLFGWSQRWMTMGSVVFIQTAVVVYFSLFEPLLWPRFVTNSFAAAFLCVFLCVDIRRAYKKTRFLAFHLFLFVFAVHGTVFAIAGAAALFKRPAGGYSDLNSGASGIAILEGLLMFFIASICVAILVPEKLKARLKSSAITDALSGLYNRAYFMEQLDADLEAESSGEGALAVMYLDLDGFKEVNDQYGHHVGDVLLMHVSEILADVSGSGTVVARMGGDEFAIIVRGERALRRAKDKASAIIAALSQPFHLQSVSVLVNTSVGIAQLTKNNETAVELVRRADIAMYAAKKAGRGQFTVFSKALDAELREANWLKTELSKAIDNDEIEVLYQPKFAMHYGKFPMLVAVEALARWTHADRGKIEPSKFIPVAEQSGLILELGQHVLQKACEAAAHWPEIDLCVNISPRQFNAPNLVQDILWIAEKAKFSPRRLELEITEGVLLSAGHGVRAVIAQLQSEGVKLAVDDFGTGYASFSYLRDYKFNTLKIDRSFVSAMEDNAKAMAVTKAVVALAHALELQVTAEGVETREQLELLTGMGCDLIQGFFLAKPMPADAITDLLEQAAAPAKQALTA
ncbi:MAG: EAL domain-containing protein [Pseudomonadota bacterium]